MRRIVYTLLMIVLYASCAEQEILFEGPYFVRFTEETMNAKESFSDVIPISVHLGGPQIDENIRIQYSISGSAREGRDFEIVESRGTVVIPRNQSFGYIPLRLLNNSNNILESQEIVFTLLSVEPSNLKMGFGDQTPIGRTLRFTIFDDCILGGRYHGNSGYTQQTYTGIDIVSTDCITYRLSNWDIGVFEFPETRDLIFTDNGDNTVTIPQQEDDTLPAELATLRGDGFVNAETRELTLNIQLVDFDDQPVITVRFKPI